MPNDFTEKELQVIRLINPDKTPEETCAIVLRDWFNSQVARRPFQFKSTDEMVDDIVAANAIEIAQQADMSSGPAII